MRYTYTQRNRRDTHTHIPSRYLSLEMDRSLTSLMILIFSTCFESFVVRFLNAPKVLYRVPSLFFIRNTVKRLSRFKRMYLEIQSITVELMLLSFYDFVSRVSIICSN